MLGLLTCLLHLTHERPECGGKNLLRNVATYLPLNTAPNTRTLKSSAYEDSGRRYSVTWQAVRVATFQESIFVIDRIERNLPEYRPKHQWCLLLI